ncbi:hypothetical protein BS17DRAFT_823358 [Gyrodon lividus]|nr:hypothetical protein BS17DRAFT_823358 [Gyrodon lividus]
MLPNNSEAFLLVVHQPPSQSISTPTPTGCYPSRGAPDPSDDRNGGDNDPDPSNDDNPFDDNPNNAIPPNPIMVLANTIKLLTQYCYHAAYP